MTPPILDLFAGPGGWSLGLRLLGLADLGVEINPDACATRTAAGHATVCADVAALDPATFDGITGLIGSPPCQTFSAAGKRLGVTDDLALCHQAITDLATGRDTRPELAARCQDRRSLLIAEPLRYALALRPEWVALEQVPQAAPLFTHIAVVLRTRGYQVWHGELNAADYGVPQTRRRRILLAHKTRPVSPPEPTHAPPTDVQPGLFGTDRRPWVTMADALYLADGVETVTRANRRPGVGGNVFPCDRPSWLLTGRARSWVLRNGNRTNAAVRRLAQPAPTLHFGHAVKDVNWQTLDGTPVRGIAPVEAAVLQGFPPDYPFAGSRTAKFRQIGDAVPPPLAAAVLGSLLGLDWRTALTTRRTPDPVPSVSAVPVGVAG
ncbi:DNA cytosine methyltransferase [Planotetraspora phitsanulokensis]|uniref:DNA (cytosine-5-)-methyltransferase n=1 Tax=Planotetraspora phitsanulokensis TaxID=575192 RepID=A0A8J3UEK0_9ACTN|nr:DNA cytosine methyltransferase [Planotetraspora phitsanulokensis]GII40919.1 DNA methylase [Planotetraspora phitsanulokensis]